MFIEGKLCKPLEGILKVYFNSGIENLFDLRRLTTVYVLKFYLNCKCIHALF